MIAIIDGDTFKFTGREGDSKQIIFNKIDDYIKGIISATNSDEYLMFLTKGRESFRYKVFPSYKSNRLNKDKPKYYEDIQQYLIENYNGIYELDKEADDLIGIHSTYYKDSIICSIDSDFTTLPSTIYNYRKNMIINVSKEKAYYNFHKYLILGQIKDNIPKFRNGFGEKKVEEYLYKRGFISSELKLVLYEFYSKITKDLFILGYTTKTGKKFKGYNEEEGLQRYNLNVLLMKIVTTEQECIDRGITYNLYNGSKTR